MKCPNCNRSVSLLTLRSHQATHDPAVAAELAEELRRYRARQRQRDEDREVGRNLRIRRCMKNDDKAFAAEERRPAVRARADELRPNFKGNLKNMWGKLAEEFHCSVGTIRRDLAEPRTQK